MGKDEGASQVLSYQVPSESGVQGHSQTDIELVGTDDRAGCFKPAPIGPVGAHRIVIVNILNILS